MKHHNRRSFMQRLGVAAPIAASAIIPPVAGAIITPPAGHVGDFPPKMPPPKTDLDYPRRPKRYPTTASWPFVLDRRPYALYCRQRRAAPEWNAPEELTPQAFTFFSTPIGCCDSVGMRTWQETNMYKAGGLPAPQRFMIERMFFLFSPYMVEADRDALMDRYGYNLRIGQKNYHKGPLLRFPNVVDFRFDYTTDKAPHFGEAQFATEKPADQIGEELTALRDKLGHEAGAVITSTVNHSAHTVLDSRSHIPFADYAPAPQRVDFREPYQLVIDWEVDYFGVEVIGEPFMPAGPINFICVLDGVMDFPIQ